MKNFKYVITDSVGIHARPAGLLAKKAKNFSSVITIKCGEKSAQADKLMAIMTLGVKKGMEVEVIASGDDEDTAIEEMKSFFKEHL